MFAAARVGWAAESDDLLAARITSSRLEIAGIGRPLAVPADVALAVGERAWPIEGDVRRRLELLLPRASYGWRDATRAVVVDHGSAPGGTVEDLAARTLWDVVLASYPCASDAHLLRQALPVLAAISRLPASRLSLGSDSATRLESTAELLATIAGHD